MTAESSRQLDELDPPLAALDDSEASEIIRFWVAHGEDHVQLRIGALGPLEREPEIWGSIIADICKHTVMALEMADHHHGSKEEIMARLMNGFRDRISQSPNLSGQINRALN